MQLFRIKKQLMNKIPSTPTSSSFRELLEYALYETKHIEKKSLIGKHESIVWFSTLNKSERAKILKKVHKEYLKEEKLKTN